MARYGLDHATLAKLNPRLVYCSITGFGQTGPYRERAGYDYAIQGMGGLMSVTGERDDLGGGPQKVGVAVADLFTGMYATVAILAALRHAERTGEGQHIDLALLDVQVASLANQGMNYLYSGQLPRRMGNAHPNTVPYQDFPTADGHMILAIGNDGQFAKFCDAAGRAEWASDARFATNAARVTHRQTLIPLIQAVTQTRNTHDWVSMLEHVGVPCGPIHTVDQVYQDPQVQARQMTFEMQHPSAGPIPLVANPIRMSQTPVQYRHAPPMLGQHTDEVLAEVLGMTQDTLNDLKQQGVFG
jgi:crotonobetainyl-CoA:carnitine CoA-transferase CaiB-like acyl-CoA transferase